MYDEIKTLAQAINNNDYKAIKKLVKTLNRCGCDNYTIYSLLIDKNICDIKINKMQVYQLLSNI